MRKPLDVPIESRDGDVTLTKDSKLCNFMKDPLSPEKILKRPGMWQSNVFAPAGQGSGITIYKDIIYSWTNGNAPTTGVINESVMVRGVLDFVDNGDGTYTLTLSPNNPFIVGDLIDLTNNVVNFGSAYQVSAIDGISITISLVTSTGVWVLKGSSISAGTGTIYGAWFHNSVFYLAFSPTGVLCTIKASSGNIYDPASYSTVATGVSINDIPLRTYTSYFFSDGTYTYGISGGNRFITSDGISWTNTLSNLPVTGFLNTAYKSGYFYVFRSVGEIDQSSDMVNYTTISPSGLPALGASNGTALSILSGTFYWFNFKTDGSIVCYSSTDATNWTSFSTVSSGVSIKPWSISVINGYIYILCQKTNSAFGIYEVSTNGSSVNYRLTEISNVATTGEPNVLGKTNQIYSAKISGNLLSYIYQRT